MGRNPPLLPLDISVLLEGQLERKEEKVYFPVLSVTFPVTYDKLSVSTEMDSKLILNILITDEET